MTLSSSVPFATFCAAYSQPQAAIQAKVAWNAASPQKKIRISAVQSFNVSNDKYKAPLPGGMENYFSLVLLRADVWPGREAKQQSLIWFDVWALRLTLCFLSTTKIQRAQTNFSELRIKFPPQHSHLHQSIITWWQCLHVCFYSYLYTLCTYGPNIGLLFLRQSTLMQLLLYLQLFQQYSSSASFPSCRSPSCITTHLSSDHERLWWNRNLSNQSCGTIYFSAIDLCAQFVDENMPRFHCGCFSKHKSNRIL